MTGQWEQEQQQRREAMQEMKQFWGDETFEFEAQHCDMEMACRLSYCGLWDTRYIYGLYDVRSGDIFYVGSTFDLTKRFAGHLRNNSYVLAMLERGAFPIPFLIGVYRTVCDQYSREVELHTARLLREQGHTAFCDDCHTNGVRELAEEQANQIAWLKNLSTD